MSDFRVEGKNLIVVNASGQQLWRHTFPVPLLSGFYKESRVVSVSWMGTLERGAPQEFLFLQTPVTFNDGGTSVVCFDAYGRIRWEFLPGQRIVTDASGDRMLPPYFGSELQVMRGKVLTDTRIAVTSIHHTSQPDQVAFLDTHGRVVGEYWHPGHLSYLGQADLDGDERNELILAGVNNGEHQATLVVLDPLRVSGTTTPLEMRDQRFRLLNMPASKEKAVVLFPRSCISTGLPYTRVSALRITKERLIVDVAEGPDQSTAGFVYELDYNLRVTSVVPNSHKVRQIHQQLEADGILDHPFDTSRECDRLKAGVLVRRGH